MKKRATTPRTTRYIVSWIPEAAVEAAARAAGMVDGDGTSFWDWTSQEEHETARRFSTFPEAVAFARKIAPTATFRVADIDRQQQTVEGDELGSWIEWNTDASWEVEDGRGQTIDEASPLRSAA